MNSKNHKQFLYCAHLLVYLSLTNFFVIFPEQEIGKGFSDLWVSPNFLHHPEMRHCYILEFKYLTHNASDYAVAGKMAEAHTQLQQYATDTKYEAAKGSTTLHRIAVTYRAWELAALEEIF